MSDSSTNPFWSNFLGESPSWYKKTIIAFIAINPILLSVVGPVVTGWALIGEFIFTLALALRCYPLQPGGLLADGALPPAAPGRWRCVPLRTQMKDLYANAWRSGSISS